jgi:hypothetical protein
MKTSVPRGLGDESPSKENPNMKTSVPRRPEDEGSRIKKALETYMRAEKIPEAKAWGMKTFASRRS